MINNINRINNRLVNLCKLGSGINPDPNLHRLINLLLILLVLLILLTKLDVYYGYPCVHGYTVCYVCGYITFPSAPISSWVPS